jgi:hypothetical protein
MKSNFIPGKIEFDRTIFYAFFFFHSLTQYHRNKRVKLRENTDKNYYLSIRKKMSRSYLKRNQTFAGVRYCFTFF